MPSPLTKKIGPLPTWAYIVGGIAFVGMVWYFRKSQAADDSTLVYAGAEPVAASPGGAGGGYDDTSLGGGSLYGSDVTLGSGEGSPVGFPPDFWSTILSGIPVPPPQIYEDPTQPYQTQPAPTPSGGTQTVTAPTQTKQTSFEWGGKTWRTGDLAAFRTWLKAHGVTYATWASNHPKAAMDVFGTMK